MKTDRPRYFYGWKIVGAAFLSRFSFASGNASVLGLFFTPLNSEFGWSRTAISVVLSMARLFEGLTSPLLGPIIDRYGPRAPMVIGGIVLSLGFVGLSLIGNLWQFYLIRGVFMAAGFALTGMLVTNTAVSNWFIRRRGRAIATAGMGTNTGMLIIAPVTVGIIAVWGWQAAWLFFAVLAWIVVVIPSAILMRRRPEDIGLLPDGDLPPDSKADDPSLRSTTSAGEAVWTRREVIRTPAFWLLIIGISSAMLAFQGVNISIAPYAEDLGLSPFNVAALLMARSIATLAVAPGWGILSERVHLPQVRISPFFIQMLASAFLSMADRSVMLWLGVVCYGAGFSGMMIVQEVIWANYYGRLTLGTVRSTSLPLQVLIAGAGPVLINVVFDIVGSYRPAYTAFIGLYLLAALLVWFARPPQAKRFAQA